MKKIYPSKEDLEKVLRNGKKLLLYQGFDPTGKQLHIGHMVGLRKLRQWQDLGHHVIFLIGDFTGMVGDPTGKSNTRTPLKKEQVLENAKTYKEQASKILDFNGGNPVVIKFNSEWLEKMSANEFMYLTSLISYNQIIERDMFQQRLQKHESIGVLELLYPILQGYDSVAMKVDLEIGGSDQMFNMLVGRQLVKEMLGKEKYVMTTPLLTDSEGMKIGKTEGNVIALTNKPEDLYAKVMALPDDVIVKGFEYLTDVSMEEIEIIVKEIKNGQNPMSFKKKLAFEIVKQLNSEHEAEKAQEIFEKKQPMSIPTMSFPRSFISTATVEQGTVAANLASSNSEAKRVILQGGLKINDQVVTNPNALLITYFKESEIVMQRGPRKTQRIKPASD